MTVDQYFQQYIEGRPVSLLFLAHGDAIEVIGFNELWLNPKVDQPFRYGGAVSNIELEQGIQQQLIDAATKLTYKLGLLGLNSLDAVINVDIAYVLEINPRLSATFDLYEADLFKRHVQAIKKQTVKASFISQKKSAQAQAIVYAIEDTIIELSFHWPEWVTDIPVMKYSAITIKSGEPICSVLASAKDAETAKQLVMARVKMLVWTFNKV